MIEMRTAQLADLATVLDWAAAEGWNPGIGDAATFFAADAEGFFVATDSGVPVAAISVVNHNDTFAFLGLYIVQPAYRGRGIGLNLWNHALAHAGTRTVGLDGVPDQQANYAASGFAHAGGTTRFAGTVAAETSPLIRLATPADRTALIAAEAAASGTEKPAYLTAWYTSSDLRQTLVLERAEKIASHCTVRKCRAGAKIGPLLARDATDAEALIKHAAGLYDGEVIIDVPATSAGLTDLCERLSLTPGFETARMYRGPFTGGTDAFFAVTSLELG